MRLDQTSGLQATLLVDGDNLTEYVPPADDYGVDENSLGGNQAINAATRYVEAQSGATFSIRIEVERTFPHRAADLHCEVWMDGKFIISRLINLVGRRKRGTSIDINGIMFQSGHEWLLQPFMFGELKTTDGVPNPSQKEELKELERIQLKVVSCKIKGSAGLFVGRPQVASDGVISEKALKGRAISNYTSLGSARSCTKLEAYHVDWVYGRTPVAVFTFLYRSRRDLQVEGIIPRSPSPTPLSEMDPDTMTMDQLREFARQNQARRQLEAQVKQEQRESTSTKKHSAEPSIWRFRRGLQSRTGETIDLTED